MSTKHTPSQPPDMKCKLVVVGDGGAGKTCLIIAYAENRFPELSSPSPHLPVYVPIVFGNYVTRVSFEGKSIDLALWDTMGQGAYDRLRPLSYPDSDIFLIVFSIDFPDGLANIHEKIANFCWGTSVLLVGTKIDLRDDQRTQQMLNAEGQTTITSEQGEAVAQAIGASYMECSAKTGEGVQEVFDAALKARTRRRERPVHTKGRCVIL